MQWIRSFGGIGAPPKLSKLSPSPLKPRFSVHKLDNGSADFRAFYTFHVYPLYSQTMAKSMLNTVSETSDDSHPLVYHVFSILDQDYRYLPYNPDVVCGKLIKLEENGDITDSVDDVARVFYTDFDIDVPAVVVEQTKNTLRAESHSGADITGLYLMKHHSKFAKRREEAFLDVVGETTTPTTTTHNNRTFIMFRSISLHATRITKQLTSSIGAVATKSRTTINTLLNRT